VYNFEKYKQPSGVYEVNGHRLLVGDATDPVNVNLLCNTGVVSSVGKKPVLALCDPPYGIGIEDWDEFNIEDYLSFSRRWIDNVLSVMDPGAVYIWTTQKQEMSFHLWNMLRDYKQLEFQRELVIEMNKINAEKQNWPLNEQRCLYYKLRGGKIFIRQETDDRKSVSFGKMEDRNRIAGSLWNRKDIVSVWFKDNENVENCNIALQKPIKALKRIINASSEPGDTVIDVFSHSGSTLIACHETKRVCYTMDLYQKYIDISLSRYLDVSAQKKLF
jgi:DNA modification methylase